MLKHNSKGHQFKYSLRLFFTCARALAQRPSKKTIGHSDACGCHPGANHVQVKVRINHADPPANKPRWSPTPVCARLR
jgi:hypothetical protein